MTERMEELEVGATFNGRYRVVRRLGAGAMGSVYEVVHQDTHRRRALKVMRAGLVSAPELRARFALEATVTADIDSEHIVDTFDAGVDAETGAPYLVMELLRGEDLGAFLARRGRLPPDETIELLSQVALALDKTHAAGVVHRDLKPENLFVTRRDDGSPRLKILDFGIAKLVSQATHAGATQGVGTPIFMPPEQLHGHGSIGPRADLYAMGQLAYVMLVGASYWEEEVESIPALLPLLCRIVAGPSEPASERARRRGVALPPAFDAFFAKATCPEPRGRFAGASELVVALAEVLGLPAPLPGARGPSTVSDRPPEGAVLETGGARAGLIEGPFTSQAFTPQGRGLGSYPPPGLRRSTRPGLRDPGSLAPPDDLDAVPLRIPGERSVWPFAILGLAALVGASAAAAWKYPASFERVRGVVAAPFTPRAPEAPPLPPDPAPAEAPPEAPAEAPPEAPAEAPSEAPAQAPEPDPAPAGSARPAPAASAPLAQPTERPRPRPRLRPPPSPPPEPTPEPREGAGGSDATDATDATDEPIAPADPYEEQDRSAEKPPVGAPLTRD